MSDVEELKTKLKKEISFAQQQLLQNVETFDFSKTIENQAMDTLSDVSSSLFSNPTNLIPKLDTISRYVFKEDNIIRSVLKYAQLFLKAKQILS